MYIKDIEKFNIFLWGKQMQNKKLQNKMQSAINHLSSAIKDLQECDTMVNSDDFKYYVSQIKELLSCDNNEAGLIPFLKNIKAEV
jgi:hypothetical protein